MGKEADGEPNEGSRVGWIGSLCSCILFQNFIISQEVDYTCPPD